MGPSVSGHSHNRSVECQPPVGVTICFILWSIFRSLRSDNSATLVGVQVTRNLRPLAPNTIGRDGSGEGGEAAPRVFTFQRELDLFPRSLARSCHSTIRPGRCRELAAPLGSFYQSANRSESMHAVVRKHASLAGRPIHYSCIVGFGKCMVIGARR